MIRYYAYYSCGGYKDLYLGSSSLKADYTYFLPLLAIWQKGSKPEYAEKLRQIEGLCQIAVVSKDNQLDFPTQAKPLFTHGGYRIIYLTLPNGSTCLCVRDISNGAKDDEDRNIPFNILITASGEDVAILDRFCLNSLEHVKGLYELMSPIFSYDPHVNGIKFNIGKLDRAIHNVPATDIELAHTPGRVNFLIVDSVAMFTVALNELKLKKEQIDYVAFNDGRSYGSLSYKDQFSSNEVINTQSQPTKPDDFKDNSEQETNTEEISTDLETSTEESIQTNILDKDLNTSELSDSNLSGKAVDLNTQLSNIHDVLKQLSDSITNICKKLDEQQSFSATNVRTVLDKIDALKENRTTSLPSIPESVKDDTYVRISKVYLWLSMGALIVGVLLGALIF
jgi:hypothetical protein